MRKSKSQGRSCSLSPVPDPKQTLNEHNTYHKPSLRGLTTTRGGRVCRHAPSCLGAGPPGLLPTQLGRMPRSRRLWEPEEAGQSSQTFLAGSTLLAIVPIWPFARQTGSSEDGKTGLTGWRSRQKAVWAVWYCGFASSSRPAFAGMEFPASSGGEPGRQPMEKR